MVDDKGSRVLLECQMDDGSVWSCDVAGDNWVNIKPSDEFLTEKFQKLAQPKQSNKPIKAIPDPK